MAKILNIGFDQQFFPKSIEVNLEKCPWLIKICLIQQIKAKMIQSNYLKRINSWKIQLFWKLIEAPTSIGWGDLTNVKFWDSLSENLMKFSLNFILNFKC